MKNTPEYQVVWRGFVHETTGYSTASRAYLLALEAAGVDVKIEPLVYGQKDIMFNDDPEGRKLLELIHKPYATDKKLVLIYHAQPNGLDVRQAKTKFDYVILNTVWETTVIPDNWVQSSQNADAIFLPSSANIEAFENSGIKTPAYLVPHGSDMEKFNPSNGKIPIADIQGKFVFLSVFDWQHRKAPEVLLKAFWNEFKAEDDVVLIVKSSYAKDKDLQRQLVTQIAQYKAGLGYKDTAPLLISFNRMSDENLVELYTTADAFVLPTRGEGVGLPFIEAMSSGLPVIATAWGGQTDFLNEENSYLIDYNLESTASQMANAISPRYDEVFTSNMEWAEPKIESVQEQMRLAFNDSSLRASKAKNALEVAQNMSWKLSGEIMKETIEKVMGGN